MRPLELWGGVECTVNRVGDRFHEQMAQSGHDQRLEDLDRFAALGITALRQPVLWEHVAPDSPGECHWGQADQRLARLRHLGVRPVVGLVHHGSGPVYTSLLDSAFADKLADYARRVAERYPWVTDWTPVNEPLTTARFSALYGHWYPHVRSDRAFVRALLNELRGVVLAMRAIRGVIPGARLIQTEDAGRTWGRGAVGEQVAHEAHRRWLTWDLLTGRVGGDHPLRPFLAGAGATDDDLAFFTEMPCAPDVLGVNYYVTSDRWLDERLTLYPEWSHGGNGRIRYADVEAVRARPEGIDGHYAHLAAAWQRYGVPLAITEVHLGCTREEQLRWLIEAWRAAERARDDGMPVQAVTAWALLGSHDWDSLATQLRGRYEPGLFDVRSTPPRPTALASAAARLARGEAPADPVFGARGWWRRPERLSFFSAMPPGTGRNDARPLLVVGARGTLGRALQRTCVVRGLAVHMVSRTELDIADAAEVDAVIRRIGPWGVVNAAGYVKVDAAEGDATSCWRDNVHGPVALAAACRRQGLPLVTFSSDLVFDGTSVRPYVESDPVAPLNVYGAAKAEAERRVLDLLPTALVVRTSAFFGPWDDYNFATLLLRAVRARQRWPAPRDCTVSPTYVPDLVNAVLDLLIDGESGIWHLANQGAVTWYEFGHAVADRLGVPTSLIAACGWREAWQPAPRPAYGVLGSERGLLLRPLPDAIDEYCGHMRAQFAREAACASS